MNKTISRKKQTIRKEHHTFWFNDTRGQISLDFISGTVIFMVAFLFLFQTLTSLFVPFQSNSDEIKSMADRVGMTLAESTSGLAHSPTDVNIISVRRAEDLNEQMNSTSGYNDVLNDFGLKSETTQYNLNLSLCNISNSLYLNSSGAPVLHNGPIPPQNTNVAQVIRIVYVEQDDEIGILYVKVW
jgi:hypothetical protein